MRHFINKNISGKHRRVRSAKLTNHSAPRAYHRVGYSRLISNKREWNNILLKMPESQIDKNKNAPKNYPYAYHKR